jgi:hypothetical protein
MSDAAAHPLYQLRFLFENAVPELRFVPGVSAGDIARLCSGPSARRAGLLRADDVTLAVRPDMPWLPGGLGWRLNHSG